MTLFSENDFSSVKPVGVTAVFTCMGSHVGAQVAGLIETLPALMTEIQSMPHERPQHR